VEHDPARQRQVHPPAPPAARDLDGLLEGEAPPERQLDRTGHQVRDQGVRVRDELDFYLIDPRAAQVISLRFFSGMSSPEVAEHLGVSVRTVEGDWAHARAWLKRELARTPADDASVNDEQSK